MTSETSFIADMSQPGAALRRPWKNGIAVGRAADLLRADLQRHLRWLQGEIGFRTCRFHAIFHDDIAVARRRADGPLAFHWHQADKVYDALLGMGLRPFVELNPMPAALASGERTMFYYKMNVTPPRRWEEWGELVREFAVHLVERYGLPEVRQWHFEVWNEPNLEAFWAGSRADYFRLYAEAARALKSVDAGLRVGGPATSKAYWLGELIAFCDAERVPLDFVSTHLYPQDEFVEFADRTASPHRPGMFFQDTIRRARETVRKSAMPHLPVHWTEWNTQLATSAADVTWCGNRYVDSLHGASFVARNMIELDDAAETFTFWVASDIFEEGPMPSAPFSQTYGLVTIHGIPKATANAFRLLERLRGPRLPVKAEGAEPPPLCGAVSTLEGDAAHLLLWNDALPDAAPGEADWPVTLRVRTGAGAAAEWVVTETRIRAGAGSAFETWEALGCPADVSPAQLDLLRAHAVPACRAWRCRAEGGVVTVSLRLGANEVAHLEVRPAAHRSKEVEEPGAPQSAAELDSLLSGKSRED